MPNCFKNPNIEHEGVKEPCHLGSPSAGTGTSLAPLTECPDASRIAKDARTAVPCLLLYILI